VPPPISSQPRVPRCALTV